MPTFVHDSDDWANFFGEEGDEFREVSGNLCSPYTNMVNLLGATSLIGHWRFGQLQTFEDQGALGNDALQVVRNPSGVGVDWYSIDATNGGQLVETGATYRDSTDGGVAFPGVDVGFQGLPLCFSMWFQVVGKNVAPSDKEAWVFCSRKPGASANNFALFQMLTLVDEEGSGLHNTQIRTSQDDTYGFFRASDELITTIGPDWSHPPEDEGWHHLLIEIQSNTQSIDVPLGTGNIILTGHNVDASEPPP